MRDKALSNLPFLTTLRVIVLGLSIPVNFLSGQDALSPWDVIDLYGDLRLRYESDFDSVKADGTTGREDRHRLRTRARLGLKITPTDLLTFDVRLRYGDSQSQQSPHVTLWQDESDYGDQSDVWIDRVMLQFTPANWTIRAGRSDLPLWKPHELYWDDDVFLDGISIAHQTSFDQSEVDSLVGAWLLPDGPDDNDFSEHSRLIAGQVKLKHQFANSTTLTLANSLLFIDDADEVNRTNDDTDYAINALDLQYQANFRDIPFTVGATWMHNLKDGPSPSTRKETDGFVLYGTLGTLRNQGDWLFGYYYADIEKYAVARFFAQDDWSRLGSATQTRSSDFRGHELRLGHSLTENLNLILRAYHVDTISSREDGNRLRIDLNYRF